MKKVNLKKIMNDAGEFPVTEVKFSSDILAGVSLKVKKYLSFKDSMSFIADIYYGCTNDVNAEYTPEAFAIQERLALVTYYTNAELTTDPAKLYRLLFETDLYKVVREHVDEEMYRYLIDAAKEKIRHWQNVIMSVASAKMIDLANMMEHIESQYEEVIDVLKDLDFEKAAETLKKMNITKAEVSPLKELYFNGGKSPEGNMGHDDIQPSLQDESENRIIIASKE